MIGSRDWVEEWRSFLRRRNELLGMNARNLEVIFEHNLRKDFPLVDDKCITKDLLSRAGVATPRTLGIIEGFPELEGLENLLLPHDDFVIKPACGSGGSGVFLAAGRAPGGYLSPSGRFIAEKEMRRHVAEILYGSFSTNRSDKALIEERLLPHPFFKEFYPVGLADIRVIVFKRNPALCMLRLPTSGSHGTANLHQGGVGLGVDVRTGTTTSAVCRGRKLVSHPDSGKPLIGAEVPLWEEVIRTAVHAASQVPLGYVGVDLVLVPGNKVVVLELNARPGLQIQNATRTGLRTVLGL
jgi:alpha-L-glutamate ligase-like protein